MFYQTVQNIHTWGESGVQIWILMSLCKDTTAFLKVTSSAMTSMGTCYLKFQMPTRLLFFLVSTHLMLEFCLLPLEAAKVSCPKEAAHNVISYLLPPFITHFIVF